MATTYNTKLFRSVLDCGCNLGLGEFAEEAEFDDVEKWVRDRGYELTQVDRVNAAPLSELHPELDTAVTR